MEPQRAPPSDLAERLVRAAEENVAQQARTELFFREFALHLAKQATRDFSRRHEATPDAPSAVAAFLAHETASDRMRRGEITMKGEDFRLQADVHACPYAATCKTNLQDLGEVPQCVRAITLIQAIGARVPDRPPMTYDLRPGLVDGLSASCEIRLRPAGLPDLEPVAPLQWRARS